MGSRIQYNQSMSNFPHLSGVFAAALTPLTQEFAPDLEAIPLLLAFLAKRGCHGALLLGTTGEGPSYSPEERKAILEAAVLVRQVHPGFKLLAGTGTPSLDETIKLTRAAFDLGIDAVVVLPPYYFKKVPDEGLFNWFSQVIQKGLPSDGQILAYHIPAVSGVPVSLDLLEQLECAYPDRFVGLKDSSGDPQHALDLGNRFGKRMIVLNGNDRLFSLALQSGAAGCITAMANLFSPDLRRVWDAHQNGSPDELTQQRLSAARQVMDRFPPAPPLLKSLLAAQGHFPLWAVRPPLIPASAENVEIAVEELSRI